MAQQVTVQESQWEALSSCDACAKCGDTLVGKTERSKTFTFSEGDKKVGEWYVLEIAVTDCDRTEYRVLSPRGMEMGPDVYDHADMALLDMAQEVRKAVPGMNNLIATDNSSEWISFLLEHWQEPLPVTDPRVIDRN